jgi:RNA 2',3'-cyclic 3'-phosphodiesterase
VNSSNVEIPTKRLFIALKAGSGVEEEILSTQKKLRISADKKEFSVRWTPADNWHVTLVFIGDTAADQVSIVEQKIQDVCLTHAPFSLKINDLGGFPSEREARVIWAGVQRSKGLLHLQGELQRQFSTSEHNYSPHLTLGRLKNPKSIVDLISPFVRKKFGKMEVSEIILFESILATPFPVYKKLSSFVLSGQKEVDAESES